MRLAAGPEYRHLAGRLLAFAAVLAVSLAAGCDSSKTIQKRDLERFRGLYEKGLESPDPFVRAETLRLMETLRRRDLPGTPATIVRKDSNPMVRVAALRALLATGHPDAEGFALNRFTAGNSREKRGVLEAVLEYASEGFKRRLVWRALRPGQPPAVRDMAVRRALVPWVQRAKRNDEKSVVERLLVSNVQKYIRKLDTGVGGAILRLLSDLGREDAAKRVVDVLDDGGASLSRRLRAARILAESRASAGRPIFRRLLERARDQSEGDALAVPEEGMDERLLQWAVLGLVAHGNKELVPRAKSHLEGGSAKTYIRVLGILRTNPAEGARLALENSMVDARPPVRHRAIELYARRSDATAAELVDTLLERSFSKRAAATRRQVAEALGQNFSTDWVRHLSDDLESAEGRVRALELLVDVYEETGRTGVIEPLRGKLRGLLSSKNDRLGALAGYLLVQLPDEARGDELDAELRELQDPLPRYAYLESLVRSSPDDDVGFLLDNFYAREGAPENFNVRLLAGAGLWLVRHPESTGGTGPDAGSS